MSKKRFTPAELGKRGADATNSKLTAEERKANASKAAKAKWAKWRREKGK